jgi:DNA-binding transcriptional LysR family regulator
MARIELRHLRYFVAVAEEGGFTRAAARLHIQQPPLSQQLQALEGELGMRLLERKPRGVELTPAGAAFLEDARAILASVEGAQARVKRVAAGMEGALAIGLASSAATHPAVPRLLAAYREVNPRVHLRFVEGNAASLSEAVVSGGADVAFVRAPVDFPPGVRFLELLEEPMLAVVARSHELAKLAARRKPAWVTLREMARHPFVLVRRPGAPGMYSNLLVACAEAGLAPRIAAEVGNMLTNVLLVAAGVGVSVVPASMRGIQGELVDYVALRGARRLAAPLTVVSREGDANPCLESFVSLARRRLHREA